MSTKPKEVCRFYLQGTCKFGNRCYNIHPDRGQGGAGGGNWRGGTSGNWGGGGGGGGNWRGPGGTGGGNNWSGGGGGGGGRDGGNWRGGGGSNNWNGGGNNWRGPGGSGGGRNNGTSGDWGSVWNSPRGGNQQRRSWEDNNAWQRKGGTNWSSGANNWTVSNDKSSGIERSGISRNMGGDNVFFRSIQQGMDTSDDNPDTIRTDYDKVKSDITQWVHRKIWPLSSYTPSVPSQQTSLKGFDDHSQEEIRWQALIATAQGSPDTYLQLERELMEKRRLLWQEYAQMSFQDMSRLQLVGDGNTSTSPPNGTSPSFFTNPREPYNQFGMLSKDLFGAKNAGTGSNQPPPLLNPTQGGSSSIFPPGSGPSSGQTSNTTSNSSGNLPEDVLTAYKADKFVLGQVPETPPPTSLCF